jgi:long-chain acyl-CoA synthetase
MEKIESFKELVDSFQGNHDLAFSSFENATNITYNDLHHQIYLYIDKLHEIDKDDKVVLFNLPNIEWICIYFAVILKNGIIVPVDTRVSESFLHSVIENIKPKIIISNSLEQSTVKSLTVKELLTRKSITTSVSTNKKTSEKVSEILFTSGTWGIPKGVMLSQKNLLTNAYQILDIYHHKKEDTSLSILPMSHAYQQTAGLIIPLIVGSHVVFLEKPDSFKIIEAIKKYKIKTIPVVPKVLDLIKSSILRKIHNKNIRSVVRKTIVHSSSLPIFIRKILFKFIRNQIGISLKNFIVGGALLSKETDDFFRGLGYKLCIGYGLTETSPVISLSIDQKRREGNVGQIVKGLKYSKNENGELLVSGDNVFLGYYPDYNNKVFNTGDVIDFDKNNNLILKGRTKNLIIWPTGDKIFAEDLEYIISKITNTEEVCVVHKLKQDTPVIYCAIKSEQTITIDLDHLHSKLPNNIKIEKVTLFSSNDFPYTHTLKPNRQKILELFTK